MLVLTYRFFDRTLTAIFNSRIDLDEWSNKMHIVVVSIERLNG